jgi:hypothetical protein
VVVADFVPRGGVGAEHSGGHEPEPRTPAPLGLSRFGSAVCGYEHNGATHREMCLEPGQGWILFYGLLTKGSVSSPLFSCQGAPFIDN